MKFKNYSKVLIFFISVFVNCTGVSEKVPSQNEPFIGTWKFISLSGESTEDDVFRPYGENLFGKLIYNSDGYMSVLLMKPDRPRFKSGDVLKGTPEEIKIAFENFDAYCGTYKIDTNNRTVTHIIEGSRFPNWVGTQQMRNYEFIDDTLKLSARILINEKEWDLKAILIKL